jgi:probable phosphoglycerate mutase
MKTIITVQHTESEHHVNGMVGGSTDWSLTERGLKQAEEIGETLAKKLDLSLDYRLFSSDMLRTKQTVEQIAKHLSLTPIFRAELRECGVGEATGKSREWSLANRLPNPGNKSWITYRPHTGAETGAELYVRVSRFVEELENSDGEKFIIVGHGGSLQQFAARWLKIPLELQESMQLRGNAGGVSIMGEFTDDCQCVLRTLRVWNDKSYFNS